MVRWLEGMQKRHLLKFRDLLFLDVRSVRVILSVFERGSFSWSASQSADAWFKIFLAGKIACGKCTHECHLATIKPFSNYNTKKSRLIEGRIHFSSSWWIATGVGEVC